MQEQGAQPWQLQLLSTATASDPLWLQHLCSPLAEGEGMNTQLRAAVGSQHHRMMEYRELRGSTRTIQSNLCLWSLG